MSRLLLAVDGGGTGTEFCVADMHGSVLFSVFSGSTSFKSVGRDAAFANLTAGLAALAARGVMPADIAQGVWGMSGCDTPEDALVFEKMLVTAGLSLARHCVVNDTLPAFWAGAEAPGAVLIAGTGSIAVGFDCMGSQYRAGGWNYAYSDLGSGYWLGCALLRQTALWLDGCREYDPIFAQVREKAGAASDAELLNRLASLTDADALAAFAPLALAENGSAVCAALRAEAADLLSDYAAAVLNRLQAAGEANLTLVLAGGLFRSEAFRALVTEAVQKKHPCTVVYTNDSPALGGIRLARHRAAKAAETE